MYVKMVIYNIKYTSTE